MDKKNYKLYILIFLGFLLFVLPIGGISIFQVSKYWWVWNSLLLLFGAFLMRVAISMQLYRMAVIAGGIIIVAISLYFVIGPYQSAKKQLESANGTFHMTLTSSPRSSIIKL